MDDIITLEPGRYFIAYVSDTAINMAGDGKNYTVLPFAVNATTFDLTDPYEGSFQANFNFNPLPANTGALTITNNNIMANMVIGGA